MGRASVQELPPGARVALVRYHPGGGELGAPYTFVCTALRDGEHARILGAAGEFTPAVRRAVSRALHEWGVLTTEWVRKNNTPRRKTSPTKG